MRHGRLGASLVEALIALILGAFIVNLGLTTLLRLNASLESSAQRADVATALRVARHVLRAELATTDPVSDRWVGTDTMALRAFRGMAIVCPSSISGTDVTVAYAGTRRPDPAKDSLEVIAANGVVTVLGLQGVGASGGVCPVADSAEAVELWRTAGSVPSDALLLRFFERGSYHLSAAALRYRADRGGGRQPLTEEVLDDTGSRLVDSTGAVGAILLPADGSPGWSGLLERRRVP